MHTRGLKRQCHEIFWYFIFSWNETTLAPGKHSKTFLQIISFPRRRYSFKFWIPHYDTVASADSFILPCYCISPRKRNYLQNHFGPLIRGLGGFDSHKKINNRKSCDNASLLMKGCHQLTLFSSLPTYRLEKEVRAMAESI